MLLIGYTQHSIGLHQLDSFINQKIVSIDVDLPEDVDSPGMAKYRSDEHRCSIVCDTEKVESTIEEVAKAAKKADHFVVFLPTGIGLKHVHNIVASETAVHVTSLNLTLWGSKRQQLETAEPKVEGEVSGRTKLKRYAGGRPPLGTTTLDGWVVPGDDYEAVQRTLERYRSNDIDAEAAAKALDTTKKTVRNAAERTELYGLE